MWTLYEERWKLYIEKLFVLYAFIIYILLLVYRAIIFSGRIRMYLCFDAQSTYHHRIEYLRISRLLFFRLRLHIDLSRELIQTLLSQ